jgi:hypothetical protein
MEMLMTLVEMVNSDPRVARLDLATPPAALAASPTTAAVAAGAVATAPAIGRAID